MKIRALIVSVEGGLCNRLRALSSCTSWAEENRSHLALSWPADATFGATFDDLYDHPVRQVSPSTAHRVERLTGGLRDHTQVSSRRLLQVVHTGWAIEGTTDPYGPLRTWRPLPEIRARISDVSSAWVDQPAVGVMIRAHESAHPKTKEASPPEWFFDRMRELRADDPDLVFFLSTDSPAVSAATHSRFDGVVEMAKPHGYNTREAIRDALCDLYLLAGTTYILGSYWSSFAEVAAVLAGHGGFETSQQAPVTPWEERAGRLTAPP